MRSTTNGTITAADIRAGLAWRRIALRKHLTERRLWFTFVSDIVAATKAAALTPEAAGGVFNIGAGSRISLEGALRIVGELVGRSLEVVYQRSARGDVRDTGADTTRAMEVLGFKPMTELKDGLAAEFEWLRSTRPSLPVRG